MKRRKNVVLLIREELGLSQEALAERVGCHQSDVSNFERGVRSLSGAQCLAWMEALAPVLERLGIDPADLLRLGRE
jgi:transcriptional regulator with XRE-family HTH domain